MRMKIIILSTALLFGGCSATMITTRTDSPQRCTTSYALPVLDTAIAVAGAVGVGAMATQTDSPADVKLTVGLALTYLLFGYSAYRGVDKVDKCRRYR